LNTAETGKTLQQKYQEKKVVMASVILKKPYVGFATGIIFGFLGMLLIHIDTAPDVSQGIVPWMFRIVGYFLLFVALSSVVTAGYILRRNAEVKRGREK
jgi:hypothetical protein